MKTCPNCGHENNEHDRFCANCGARLTPVAPTQSQPTEDIPTPSEPEVSIPDQPEEQTAPASTSSIPPAVTPSFATNPWEQTDREPVDDEWKMSDLGPPPGNKRRTWLWIIIAILAFFVLACCGFLFWVSATDAGSSWFSNLATQVSEQATEAAR